MSKLPVEASTTEVGSPPERELEPPRASRFANLHSRTFEMELLISGAVVFALLQVPALLNRSFDLLVATLDGTYRTLVIYGHVYAVLILFALIVFFVLHLALRAYWIGLVGLESVFPGGIHWDGVSLGPHSKRHLQRKLRPLPEHIERLDDLCSLVFSFAFLIAHSGIYSLMILTVSMLLGAIAAWTLPFSIDPGYAFFFAMGLVLVPQIAVAWTDKYLGKRLAPESRAARWLARWIAWTYRLSPLPMIGHIQLTLQSRFSERRTSLAIFASILLLSFGMVGHALVRTDVLRVDSLYSFPDDLDSFGLEPFDYRDQRAADAIVVRQPSIQSAVIETPYLELFVPYYPHRHQPLLELACPDLTPAQTLTLRLRSGKAPTAERQRLVEDNLDCLASLFRVELDGQPVEHPDWVATREPDTGLAGLMAYLPIEKLETGRHRLTLIQPGSDAEVAPAATTSPLPFEPHASDRSHTLWFWK